MLHLGSKLERLDVAKLDVAKKLPKNHQHRNSCARGDRRSGTALPDKELRLTLALQIVLALALLAGLIAPFVGNKYWHWSQLVLVLSVVLAATGFLFMAAETVRVHHVLRAKLPGLEKQIDALLVQNKQLLEGTADKKGILDLEHQLQILTRERGRVWRAVQPVGEVDNQGQVHVEIPKPRPHGLEKNTIVYAFEPGEVQAADPSAGSQYLGEFRVVEVTEDQATLEPVLLIDERTGQRLVKSKGPWSLYETMPTDRHKLYADLSEEQLQQLLPAASVEEYLRHGTPATADDDAWHKIGFDENDERVGPENLDRAVKFRYDRPLRDYAYLFSELAQQRVILQASKQAVQQDIVKLKKTLASAQQLSAFREQQKVTFASDLEGMQNDRQAIETHRDLILRQLTNAQKLIDRLLASNSEMANRLTKEQLGLIRYINSQAPAPGEVSTLAP